MSAFMRPGASDPHGNAVRSTLHGRPQQQMAPQRQQQLASWIQTNRPHFQANPASWGEFMQSGHSWDGTPKASEPKMTSDFGVRARSATPYAESLLASARSATASPVRPSRPSSFQARRPPSHRWYV